jgi:hypothetical protein
VALIQQKDRHVTMSRETRCPVCHKHIAENMIFDVYPTGTAVHYNCTNGYKEQLARPAYLRDQGGFNARAPFL